MFKQIKLLCWIGAGIFLMLAACEPALPPTPSSGSIPPPLTSVRALAPTATARIATGSISGRVTRSDGKTPINEAGIIVNGTLSENFKTVLTQKDGTYTLDKLAPDTYKMDVILPGYENGVKLGIKVAANQHIGEINFALRSESTISGKVTLADGGGPIVDASVLAFGPDGEPGAAVTMKDGTYTIPGLLTPGVYRVEVYKEGFGFASKKVSILKDGEALQEINFSSFGGSIGGQVIRAQDGTPVVGARIMAVIDSGATIGLEPQSLAATTQTGSDGRYKLESLQPLSYTLQVISPGYGTEVRAIQVLQGTKPVEANVTLQPGGSISGQVTALDGITPKAGAKLKVFDSNKHLIQSANEILTAANGEYKLVDLAAGKYTLLCSTSDSAFIVKPEVVVLAGQDTPNVNFKPDQAVGGVSGRITRADGITPIPQAIIIIASDTAAGSAESAEDGTYRVDGLPSGIYKIIAISGAETMVRDEATIIAGGMIGGVDFRMSAQ